MAERNQSDAKSPTTTSESKPTRATDTKPAERARPGKEKSKPDGDTIAEIGDAVGGPA